MGDSRGLLRVLYESRRDELRFTDADVMRAAGLSQNWYTAFKADRTNRIGRMPRPETLRKLARGLRLPYAEVVRAAVVDRYGVDLGSRG